MFARWKWCVRAALRPLAGCVYGSVIIVDTVSIVPGRGTGKENSGYLAVGNLSETLCANTGGGAGSPGPADLVRPGLVGHRTSGCFVNCRWPVYREI